MVKCSIHRIECQKGGVWMKSNSNLTNRLKSAALWILITFAALLVSQGTFAIYVYICAWLALKEFYRIARQGQNNRNPSEFIGYFGLFFFFLTASNFTSRLVVIPGSKSDIALWVIVAVISISLSAEFFYKVHQPLRDAGATLMGMIYVGLLSFLLLLNCLPGESRIAGIPWQIPLGNLRVIHLLFSVWAIDSFAYFFGRKFGKTKMCETLSPNKTWEGSVGGLIGAIIVSCALGCWFGFSLAQSIILGAIVGVSAQFGDLAESALKREFGVKDSGDLIPGHGGALDRFDSLIMAVPIYYLFVVIVLR